MELIRGADVVLALGTRLNPFSTLPGYGIDYWPKDAQVIQVDMNPSRSALPRRSRWASSAMRGSWRTGCSTRLPEREPDHDRLYRIAQVKSAWAQQLSSMDHEEDDPGTTWNQRRARPSPAG
jgi:sulfoacetaldehyde acetyltransferase